MSITNVNIDMGKRIAFDCNIQQVKPKEFDILYYGCLKIK